MCKQSNSLGSFYFDTNLEQSFSVNEFNLGLFYLIVEGTSFGSGRRVHDSQTEFTVCIIDISYLFYG